jgi:xylan 1,4-beta-xylosidase
MYDLKTMVDSSVRRAYSDVGGMAAKDQRTASVMLWNYHDDDVQQGEVPVEVKIEGFPATTVTLTEYRIDDEHSNSYEVWKKMGSPQNPTKEQVAILEKSGQLKTIGAAKKMKVIKGVLNVKLSLPRQAVSLLKLDW